MKKLLSFLALALCFVACQNESVEVVSNGDLADVVLTIDAPELGVTRADGDFMEDGITPKNAKNSAFGAIDFLTDADWDNYDLRYILEVYAKDDDGINNSKPIYRERLVNCLDKYAPTTFELRLVPNRTYKFVVFADFVAEGSAEATDKLAIADLYYNTADLHNVTAITTESTWGAMNEIRDAYFVTENVEIKNSLTKDLTLTRPFAKLRVIATDLDYIANYSEPGYVEVKYHTEKIFKSFNAVNGNLNAAEMTGNELEYGYEVSKTIPYTAGYDAESTNQTLFTDYLLAKEGEQSTVNFTITVYEDKTKARKIHEHDFNTQIPIQRNHLTTLIGDILTTQANIQILINDNFADKEFVVGYKDPVFVESWGAGQSNANGNIEFIVKGENDFKVTVNGAAVSNGSLTIGEYVLESKAEQGNNLTFTVEELQATRALGAVEVLDGTMIVAADQNDEDEYNITLDLLIEHEDDTTDRAVYEYNGEILFGETLDTPKVEAAVEGNVVTLTWTAVEDATSYFVAMNDGEAIETTELTKVYTDLAWNTTYTFSVYAKSKELTSVTTTVEATVEAEPVVEPEEPTALAAPVVNASVDGNVVTLTWVAVDNAGSYSVKVDDGEEKNIDKATGYVFEGEYSTAYKFTVYAIPADTAKYAKSEGGTATATTEAEVETPTEPTVLTVAQFLALTGDDVVPSDASEDVVAAAPRYILKGTITSVTQTTYGNFYLNDGTGEVLIYGLCSPEGANKFWAESGAKVGDDITVKTIRTEFNGSPQGKNAIFIDLKSPGTLAFYTVSTYAVDFASAGGEQVVNVDAYNTDATVTATSDNSTFAVNVDGYNVTISAAANELEEEVTGNITIKVGDLAESVIKVSLAAKPAAGVVEGGSSDFNTISDTSTSYVSGETTAGWAYTNCAIFKGGTSDSSPAFKMIGEESNRALCMNGKTSAQGTITSPTINTGCGTLKFNYGLPFSDTKIKFSVDIIQNGEIVKTFTVDNSSATKLTKYSFEEAIDLAGEFQIVFKNLSPSNSTSNKDRTAIWDVEWTGKN